MVVGHRYASSFTTNVRVRIKIVPEFVAIPKPAAELLLHGTGNINTLPWNVLFPAVIWYTLIVAWDWEASLHGVWFVALIDGIVKYIILKIGGSKLYEEKVVPFVGGFILGTALEVLVAAMSFFVFFPQAA